MQLHFVLFNIWAFVINNIEEMRTSVLSVNRSSLRLKVVLTVTVIVLVVPAVVIDPVALVLIVVAAVVVSVTVIVVMVAFGANQSAAQA